MWLGKVFFNENSMGFWNRFSIGKPHEILENHLTKENPGAFVKSFSRDGRDEPVAWLFWYFSAWILAQYLVLRSHLCALN